MAGQQTCSEKFPKDPKRNVPRNIVSYEGDLNSATKCNHKCYYWFDYAASSTAKITTLSDHINIDYDAGGTVSFNTATYIPKYIRIYRPSLHTYDGNQADAEIVIYHENDGATMTGMIVCIPITTSSNVNDAGTLVEQIITEATTESAVNATISNFTIGRLIPKASYYTYTGPLPYSNCIPDNNYQYVVFSPSKKGSISISPEKMNRLDNLISFSYVKASSGRNVFYNEKGTTGNGFNGENQIYIQCQPAGESKEKKIYKEPKSPLESIKDSDGIMRVILFIIIGVVAIMFSFWIFQTTMSFLSYAPKQIKIITGGSVSK